MVDDDVTFSTNHVLLLLSHAAQLVPAPGLPVPPVAREVEARGEPLERIPDHVYEGRLLHAESEKATRLKTRV